MGNKFCFTFIISILIFSSINAQGDLPETIEVQDVSSSAKYMRFKYDETMGIRHFIYEEGLEVVVEPDGNQVGIITNFTDIPNKINLQNLYYGYSIGNDESISLQTELVYNDVFPYQYDFQIDSLGQIHIAFISNYTLIYGLRGPGENGNWSFQSVFSNEYWYSMMPDITLGQNELPRIAFAAVYRTLGIEYAGGDTQIHSSFRSVQYAYSTFNGGNLEWNSIDITESLLRENYSPIVFQALNPGIHIQNGITYVAFNGDYPVAVSSRMELIRFPEIPENNFNFTQVRHDWIFEAATRATKFRTPNISILDKGILLVAGTSNTGGAMALLLENEEELPQPELWSRKRQWSFKQIEPQHPNLPIPSIYGVYDKEGDQFVGSYNYNLILDANAGTHVNDIFLISVANSGSQKLHFNHTRITDTMNVEHSYSSPNMINGRLMEIFSFREMDGVNKLVYNSIKIGFPNFDNESYRRIIPFHGVSSMIMYILLIFWFKRRTFP